ncbi:MAG: redoxin domain-containing protein [Candidatus Aminicenantes bacterium]|nr:redoxin domain-containing protein [Candidatus Aminicenantes bacterium]
MKKAALLALTAGCLLGLPPGPVIPRSDGVKIFGALSEAVPQPDRPLLLLFFSLACHVCWEELFEMRHFIENNDIPVGLIGVSSEPEEELKPFLRKFAFFHPVVSDRGRALYRRFGVRLEPFRVVLDGDRVLYLDDAAEDFFVRRDRVKRCLLEIASR